MTRTICALVLLLSASCDAQNATGATAATAATAATPAPATAGNAGSAGANDDKPLDKPDEPVAGGPGAGKFSSLSECLETCEGGDKIATNRETCRLNCDASYGAQPTGAAGSADPVGQAATCLGRCYATGPAADDCANECKSTAGKAASPPASDVLDRLGTCVRTCHSDKSVLPTNRATCELNCTQAARVAGPAPTQPATK